MGSVAAIFDVDQTLFRGHTERLFFRHLVARGLLSSSRAVFCLARLAARPRARFRDKSYLRGLSAAEVSCLARECCEEMILPQLSPQGLAQVRQHQSQGHGIVLLTGSLAVLMAPLKEFLGADWLIATELEKVNGNFTGEIEGLHPRGKNKETLVAELSRRQGLDLAQCYAYGDHLEDASLFCRVGHPVAVNPGWRLRRLARRHCWPIYQF